MSPSAPPVARLLFHSDLGQTVCSHTWSTSSFRRMYSCSAGEVVCAPQAKSDGKSQLDEVIHSKHISNLLCVGSLFCSEFVVGVSLLLSTWILSWMRATRRARSPSGPATASTISRQFLFSEDSNEVPSGCCGSRWHGEETTAWGRQRHRLLQKSTPKTAAPPRAQVPIYSESLQTTVPTGSSKGGAEEAGQRWGRGRRPDAGQRTSARGSRHRQREGITAAAEGSGDRGLVKSRSDSCGREKRPGTRAGR